MNSNKLHPKEGSIFYKRKWKFRTPFDTSKDTTNQSWPPYQIEDEK